MCEDRPVPDDVYDVETFDERVFVRTLTTPAGEEELDRDDWPVHRPEARDAPIPGRHWYAGCEPADYDSERGYHGPGPRVNPATGICEGCGERACRACGRENCPDHPDQEA